MRPFGTRLLLSVVALALSVCASLAGVREDLGYTTLSAEISTSLWNGTGVNVTQVEAIEFSEPTIPFSWNRYYVNTADPQFFGKTITPKSGSQTGYSSHATTVGQYFYGGATSTTSIATGITTIDAYNANYWVGLMGFLKTQSPSNDPAFSPNGSRIANHSWLGNSADNFDTDVLLRTDWLTQQDDLIQVAGLNNSSSGTGNTNPYPGQGFNVIAVGRTDLGFHSGTVNLPGSIYTAGRSKPDLVAPTSATSYATPLVSGAAADLIQVAHANSGNLSGGLSVLNSDGSRTGYGTIYYGETSEVIRAALMAGAAKRVFNSDGSAITSWRSSGNTTVNGLDSRYGAGQVNVRNSYYIAATQRTKSQEDGFSGNVGATGWDYDPNFGGSSGTNTTATYDFVAGWTGQQFSASLVWNLNVNITAVKAQTYSTAADLYNLNLALYNVTDGNQLVSDSTSGTENTENIFSSLIGGKTYRLQVTTTSPAFNWDYGVAWTGQTALGWAGTNGSNFNAANNWFRNTNVANATYVAGEHVVFSDAGVANPTVDITAPITPGSIYFNNAVNYTLTGVSGAITGATGIIKDGTGNVTLNMVNTYTGGTVINAGTINLGVTDALPANRALTVNTGATLQMNGFNVTLTTLIGMGTVNLSTGSLTFGTASGTNDIRAILIGSGTITKTGTNVVYLFVNNSATFTGQFIAANGEVVIAANGALGSAAGNTVVNSGSMLNFSAAYGIPESVTINGSGVGNDGAIKLGNTTLPIHVTAASNSTINAWLTGAAGISGDLAIANGVTLTKKGNANLSFTGSVTFGNNSSLSVTAGTMTASGSLNYATATAISLISGTLTLSPTAPSAIAIGVTPATITIANGTTLALNAAGRDPLTDSTDNTKHINITNNTTTGGLNVLGGSVAAGTIDGSVVGTGTAVGLVSLANNTQLSASRIRENTLTINGTAGQNTAKVTLRASGAAAGGDNAFTNTLGTLSITNGGGTYYGTLDLTNNDLVITNTVTTPYNLVADLIRSGEGNPLNPTWNGKGLTSSYAAGTVDGNSAALAGRTGLGMILNYNDPNNSGSGAKYTTFSGVSELTGGEILVKYTWYGDLDLNGIVNAADFALLEQGRTGSVQTGGNNLPGWYYGDLNYDGVVNSFDYALFAAGNSAGSGFMSLPEPSTWTLALLGGLGLWWSRRRRAKN